MSEQTGPDAGRDWDERGEAARRGLHRAGVHLVKAAIEVVTAIGAFLEEIQQGETDEDGEGSGPTRIDVE